MDTNNKENFFDKKIIFKPWGFEYVIFRNKKKLSITYLNLNYNKSTSLHCHPRKKTGFIILNGKMNVQVGLYKKNIKTFSPLSRLVIRPGLFHSLKSISKKGTTALEIETPVEKNDLLRFKDNYGRKDKPYEKKFFRNFDKKEIFFSKPKLKNSNIYYFEKNKVTVKYVSNHKDLIGFKNNSTCAILDGEIINKKKLPVLKYGEIVRVETIKKFLNFYLIKNKLLVLIASKG
tara:strand:+ start:8836 stop:9531 length:696 start_codon:yes stop_codon:yes gene_type:complete